MIGLIKRLKSQSLRNSLILLPFLFLSCEEEVKKTEPPPVVKVGESTLSDTELDFYLKDRNVSGENRAEFIRKWIERELIYLEARANNIISDSSYKILQSDNEKELAAALFIKSILDTVSSDWSSEEIENYYEKNKSYFLLSSEAFVINSIEIADKNEAEKFRTNTLKAGWNAAFSSVDTAFIVSSMNSSFQYLHQISPPSLVRILKELLPGEVSIVINMEPDVYMIVQLINRYDKFQLPELRHIYDEVAGRLNVEHFSRRYQELIRRLYSKYNVEIREGDL
jgi:hypothetical protein